MQLEEYHPFEVKEPAQFAGAFAAMAERRMDAVAVVDEAGCSMPAAQRLQPRNSPGAARDRGVRRTVLTYEQRPDGLCGEFRFHVSPRGHPHEAGS